MKITNEHIDYIIKDLTYRGIVADDVREEVIDHICSVTEKEMSHGRRFIDAYHHALHSFGHNSGLRETQKQILHTKNKTVKIMLRNYVTIAFRNLQKYRFYTFINVMGLAIGIASCLLIFLFINDELSFDGHHEDADRIFRVECLVKFGANDLRLATNAAPMADALRNDYAEIEHAGRFWNNTSMLVRRTEENFKESNVVYADSSILKIFTIPFLKGNPNNALSEPHTMIISKKTAEKYFPGEDPIGQSLIIQNKTNYKVTGVFEDMPSTSHFHFDIILSLVSNEYHKDQQWLSCNFSTYVKLKEGVDYREFNKKFPQMVDKYALPQLKLGFGSDFTIKRFEESGNFLVWRLRPLKDIHLHSDMRAELEPNSDILYVYMFGAIGFFILSIACINFMNLSTARSANRAKEVGVRKVMGSLRSHLIRQFLTESVLLTCFSFLLAIAIAWLALPFFNELSAKTLSIPSSSPVFWLLTVGAIFITGILAGVYPSFFLSAFKPVNVLKGNASSGMKSGFVRSSLVVFQFSISILLIIGTVVIYKQLDFIQTKKMGFNKDQVITVRDAYALGSQVQTFKEEILRDNRIISGTVSGFMPVSNGDRSDSSFWPEGSEPTQDSFVNMQCWRVDYDYLRTLGIKVISGRNFEKEFLSDSNAVILNETAMKMLGFEPSDIGKKMMRFTDVEDGTISRDKIVGLPIVGVVENFHFESLKQNIGPLAFFLGKSNGLISFRFEAKKSQEVINVIENKWKSVAPGLPFSYSFLDQDFSKMYSSEQRLGKIFMIFAALAIVIACLGLFALTSFTAQLRTKEIGIRKVLGASVSSIVFLLSREFGKLVVISFIISVPIAWYGIDWWLQSYTYKTNVTVWIYVIAGVTSFAIACITMSFQSLKAASNNPVKSLRSE